MKTEVFAGSFKNKEDIANEFKIGLEELDNLRIIYAIYDEDGYGGSADVFFVDTYTGTYFEVRGDHCSCYGLEGQWEPELIGDEDIFLDYAKRVKVHTEYSDKLLADVIL